MPMKQPHFEHPPVAEVALAVYFAPPLQLQSAQLGRLWDRWRDRYPVTQDQPPMPPIPIESFPATPLNMSFQFIGGFPGPRVWFSSKDGDRLLQVQSDRLVLNWRRTKSDDEYPHYEELRPAFVDAVANFTEFLASEGLGPVQFSQAEVTYINPISLSSLGSPPNFSKLVVPWTNEFSDDFLPNTENVHLQLSFQIVNPEDGGAIGRLYVEGNAALHQNVGEVSQSEVYMLQLFARGRPIGEGLEGALAFLDLGHDYVVNGFVSLTTEEIRKEWGYKT